MLIPDAELAYTVSLNTSWHATIKYRVEREASTNVLLRLTPTLFSCTELCVWAQAMASLTRPRFLLSHVASSDAWSTL